MRDGNTVITGPCLKELHYVLEVTMRDGNTRQDYKRRAFWKPVLEVTMRDGNFLKLVISSKSANQF